VKGRKTTQNHVAIDHFDRETAPYRVPPDDSPVAIEIVKEQVAGIRRNEIDASTITFGASPARRRKRNS